ncbi:MAG: SufD family Fe-S cluster assembly protein [Candidatus Peregrinibacteria bacterium]
MQFINPEGSHRIICPQNEEILLEDISPGTRSFALDITVEGENTTVMVRGKVHTTGEEKKQWDISLTLLGKNQSATLLLRGVADDASRIVFDGSGVIKATTENGKMRIDEKVFLFSKNASAQALPVLRVETDTVQSASHSASITPFSEEILFFLSSRGISPEEAKEVLKEGVLHF